MTGAGAEKGGKALAETVLPDRTAFLSGDARDRAEVAGWVAGAVEAFGRLDILVNNAGGSDGFALVHELSDEAWDNAFTFIVDSAFWATRAALPVMLEQGGGRVINISSVEGKDRKSTRLNSS